MQKRNILIGLSLALFGLILLINTVDVSQYSQNLLKKHHKSAHENKFTFPAIDPETFVKTPEEYFETMKVMKLSDKYSHKIIHHADGSVDEKIELYIHDAWKDWKHLCGKTYSDEEEEQRRFNIWRKRYIKIEENNQAHNGFTEGESCYMDLTQEEWAAQAGGRIPDDEPEVLHQKQEESLRLLHGQSVPQYVSWKGVVNLPIRNQKCGDCWANAATTAIEGLWQVLGNPYQEFSVQEDIDCAYNKTRNGCQGGCESRAYNFAKNFGAVPVQNDPYEGKYNSADICTNDPKYNSDNKKFVSDFGYIGNGDCNAVKAALANQPLSIGMDANQKFQSTKSEVLPFEPAKQINHAVVLVGYTPEYWIIQNSWGPTNGYFGYYRLAMGNTLGVCSDVRWPRSTQAYKLKPKTTQFDFLKEYGSSSSGGGAASAGINLMSFIGTKFSIFGGNYNTQLTNHRGETIRRIDNKGFYVPQGRDKTDFNFFRIAFIFIDVDTKKTFDVIFEATNDGYLQATNVKGKTVYLGQCKVNNLGNACNGLDEKTVYIWANDGTYVVRLNWHKP